MRPYRVATNQLVRRSRFSTGPNLIIEYPSPAVVHLVLNRHGGKNSFNKAFRDEFVCALNSLSANKQVCCMVLRSNVPKVFSAGADLKERATLTEPEVMEFVDSLRASLSVLANLPFPTIAAVEGVALGGGLELSLACDMRIAGSDALLGLTETALAIIPGAGGTQRLPRLLGVGKAKELIFTAKRLSAAEAASIGLVNECVPAGTAAARAQEIADNIAEKGPIALRMAKRAINEGIQVPIAQAMEIEKQCYSVVCATSDRREGLKAFGEKRKPVYKGE